MGFFLDGMAGLMGTFKYLGVFLLTDGDTYQSAKLTAVIIV